jgi:hypothetical protein
VHCAVVADSGIAGRSYSRRSPVAVAVLASGVCRRLGWLEVECGDFVGFCLLSAEGGHCLCGK